MHQRPQFRRRLLKIAQYAPLLLALGALASPALVFAWTALGNNLADHDQTADSDIWADADVLPATDPQTPQNGFSVAAGNARTGIGGVEPAPGADTSGSVQVSDCCVEAGWESETGDWHPLADPEDEGTWEQAWACVGNVKATESSGGGSEVAPYGATEFYASYVLSLEDMKVEVEGNEVTPSQGWDATWFASDYLHHTDALPHDPSDSLSNSYEDVVTTTDGRGPDIQVYCKIGILTSWVGGNADSPPYTPPIYHKLIGSTPCPKGYENDAWMDVGYNVNAKQPQPVGE